MSENRVGVYPGTFDPITNGHTDIIFRGSQLVDRLVVAVAVNAGKGPLYSIEERVALVQEEIGDLGIAHKVDVRSFDELLIDFTKAVGANLIIRGLRAVSDFEYEFQMASMNKRLNSEIETVFLMASDRHQFISSRFVKEIGLLGGDIAHFTSARVTDSVKHKLGKK